MRQNSRSHYEHPMESYANCERPRTNHLPFVTVVLGAMLSTLAAWGQAKTDTKSGEDAKVTSHPYSVRSIVVAPSVKLEALDWGGTGRPLVLLAGLGNDAHVFDTFASTLSKRYHVYAITRRGYGASDAPTPDGGNYSADRLADDVIAVLDQLNIVRPVIAGHSLAGEELSSIGSRFPARVAGLIYLDAGYQYALYDSSHPDTTIDANEMRRKLQAAVASPLPSEQAHAIADVLKDWPALEKELEAKKKELDATPANVESQIRARLASPSAKIGPAIAAGLQRFTTIECPVLAIFADPHDFGPGLKGPELAAAQAHDKELTEPQAHLFESTLPNAKVVRIAHASHYVFQSNTAEVIREMDSFIDTLK